jgi:hypothetical protein
LYKGTYFNSFKLTSAKSHSTITAIAFRGSKILLATSKNEMVLYNLQTWKKSAVQSGP